MRPDRHGWRWWRAFGSGCSSTGNVFTIQNGSDLHWLDVGVTGEFALRYWTDRTVIPTDEQGNPVSWESIGQGRSVALPQAGRDVEEDRPRSSPRTAFSNSFDQPLTFAGLEQVLRDMRAIGNVSPKQNVSSSEHRQLYSRQPQPPNPRHLRTRRRSGTVPASGIGRTETALGGASGPACQRACGASGGA